jgi:organic radical activating enzyme
MANKTNIVKVLEALQEANPKSNGAEWVEAKSIDGDTLEEVVSRIVGMATKQVMGAVVTTGGDPNAVAAELRNLLGTGIELGYTTCEVQLERKFIE